VSLPKIFIALVLAAGSGCLATGPLPKRLPRTEATSLEKAFLTTEFTPLTSVSALPAEMRSLITPVPMPIADPGHSYNYTDVVEEHAPQYRLIVGGISGNIGFVLFDAGGYAGPHQQLLLVKLSNDHVAAFCKFRVEGSAQSVGAAKAAVPASLFKLSGYDCR
jgi:hypothetical protein